MITNLAFADDYVEEIPWDKNPAFAFNDDTDKYLEAFKSVVEQGAVKEFKVKFSENVWDFNPYFKYVNDDSLRINFIGLSGELLDYCKFFVLHKIMLKKKISTVNVRFSGFKSLIVQIITENPAKSFPLITTEDLVDAINRRNATASAVHNLYEDLYQVYYFIINNYRIDVPVEIDVLKKLGIQAKKLSKSTIDEDKLPNIPEPYFKKIVDAATKVMRDDDAEYNMRAFCCALILLSQLGLRLGDIMALTTDRLHSMELKKIGKTAYYVHYRSRKPSKPSQPLLEFDIYATPLCVEAYNTLLKIREQCEFCKGNDFLFILNHIANCSDELPVSNVRFNSIYKTFMKTYLPKEVRRPWEGIQPAKVSYWNKKKKARSIELLYIPDTRQYRVHLCTALYNHGVSLVFIQKYMGHLTEYMLGYYVRPKKQDFQQEDLGFAGKLIQEVAGENITPLGGDNNGKELQEQIKAFIEKKNLNIYTDIDEIMKEFGDSIVVRAKSGGVCIKTTLIPCGKDKRSNRSLCAYGLCPNLFYMFYMADISYFDFKQAQKVYRANIRTGHTKAADQELAKLKDILHRKLIPELDQLDEKMNEKGMDYILEHYPMLHDIIANESDIRKEIDVWIKK